MKRTLFALALAGVASLTSCQKEADVNPIKLMNPLGARPAATDGVIASAVQKRLISDGFTKFSYTADGQLKSYENSQFKGVITYLSAAQAVGIHPTYKPAKAIKFQSYSSGVLLAKNWYYLLDDKGLCQHIVTMFSDKPETKAYFKCNYNEHGRLSTITGPVTHKYTAFTYDANGQLSRVRSYNGTTLEQDTQYSYKQPNATYLPDKLGHYPVIIASEVGVTPYLHIFGRLNDYLVRRRIVTNPATGATKFDYQHDYVLDADGYIHTLTTKELITNTGGKLGLHTYEVVNNDVEQ